MIPVMFMMVIAKYLEVLAATQSKEISAMIGSTSKSYTQIFKYSAIILFGVIFVEVQSLLICRAGQVGYRMANKDTYRHFLDLEPEYFNSIGKGEIQNTISRRSQAVQDMIDVITLNFFPTFLTIIFVSFQCFVNLGGVSMIIINLSIIAYSLVTIKITAWRNEVRKKLIQAQDKSLNVLMDGLNNYETIFTYNTEDFEGERYDNRLRTVEKHSTAISRSLYILNLCQRIIWSIMTILIIIYNVYYNQKSIKPEDFVFLIHLTSIIVRSLDNLGFMYGKFQAALINARMTNLAKRNIKDSGFKPIHRLEDSINAKGLCIQYGDKTIVDDASFTIRKGEKIAIIGKNGTGKSSVVRSIVKLIKSEGLIEIDGIDSKDVTDNSYKNIISYISQNTILFDGTVMQNIKYGNSKLCDEEIFRVSKYLGIHGTILKMEHGYYTLVGEQGRNLSGGERQKIIILRSILRQANILIMDEATSNLDRQSEDIIMRKILEDPSLTVLAIVHNPELLENFTGVLHIKDGKINRLIDKKTIDFNNWYDAPESKIKIK